MSAFCENESTWDEYFGALTGPSSDDAIPLRLFEWFSDTTYQPAELIVNSASELISRDRSPHCDMRVVVARLGATQLSEQNAMHSIFNHYAFPSSFLVDRIQAVTHAFGARSSTADPNVEVAWSHFLCKEVRPTPTWDEQQRRRNAFSDTTFADSPRWQRCDAYLHVRNRADGTRCTTLLCFEAPVSLIARFARLLENESWRDAVQEPFLLLAIVYEELYSLLDTVAWRLADVFRPVERVTLDRASQQVGGSKMAQTFDFASLHNIAKHCIYISEAAEAAMLTVEGMIAHLRTRRQVTSITLSDVALSHLTYRKLAIQSTQLRVRSLEKRMANIISLSFNLVTQQDSRVMQNDSNAMKAIAVLTLIFLPLTGVGSLFSTPFFNVDFETNDSSLAVARCFWIFWVITAPLTLIMLMSWIVWYNMIKEKRMRKPEHSTKPLNDFGAYHPRTWIERIKLGK